MTLTRRRLFMTAAALVACSVAPVALAGGVTENQAAAPAPLKWVGYGPLALRDVLDGNVPIQNIHQLFVHEADYDNAFRSAQQLALVGFTDEARRQLALLRNVPIDWIADNIPVPGNHWAKLDNVSLVSLPRNRARFKHFWGDTYS